MTPEGSRVPEWSGSEVAPEGNLNHIFTGKTGQKGKNWEGGGGGGELSMRQKLFKTAKTLQAI